MVRQVPQAHRARGTGGGGGEVGDRRSAIGTRRLGGSAARRLGGSAASQDVFHVHLHVFPRYRGDGFGLVADWSIKPPREELDRVARQIRDAYKRLWPPA